MGKKIIVVGGGPGGYVAAIRASQLGAEVHIVEQGSFGGTCLNVGCIPTKALIHGAELYQKMKHGSEIGVNASSIQIDWPKLMNYKQGVVNRLVQGVGGLLKANGVTSHLGKAKLKDSKTLIIESKEKTYELQGDAIIWATGSSNFKIPVEGVESPRVLSSTEALSLTEIPKSLLIVGGGVIGVEFAYLYSALGTKVTVVELLPQILPMIDSDVVQVLKGQLVCQGVTFLNQAELKKLEPKSEGMKAHIIHEGAEKSIEADYVLIAVGRRPRTEEMNLAEAGVQLERGAIQVNEYFQSNLPTVYGIGDCNGKMMLAHAASAQGVAAAEHALGHPPCYQPQTISSCVYTQPEVASVGMSELDAKKKGISIHIGTFPLAGNGKALIENGGIGMIKIVAGSKHKEILGVQIVGPRATDLIGEAALAIRLEATVDELISTIHGHPTVSEALGETAMDLDLGAIHWPPKK